MNYFINAAQLPWTFSWVSHSLSSRSIWWLTNCWQLNNSNWQLNAAAFDLTKRDYQHVVTNRSSPVAPAHSVAYGLFLTCTWASKVIHPRQSYTPLYQHPTSSEFNTLLPYNNTPFSDRSAQWAYKRHLMRRRQSVRLPLETKSYRVIAWRVGRSSAILAWTLLTRRTHVTMQSQNVCNPRLESKADLKQNQCRSRCST
jgi:hypothetical protein